MYSLYVNKKEVKKIKVLVADDEEILRKLVVDFLKKDGYEVVEASNGREALLIAQGESPDLCILDVMMPEINGIDVCRRIKESPNPIPVLILTAKDRGEDQIEAFNAGADDYISKPFSLPIMVLRVKSLLKRSKVDDDLLYKDIKVNEAKHEVLKNGVDVGLTPKEFEILLYLLKNKGNVISRETLLSHIWEYDYFGDMRSVDTHIKNLRSKIGDDIVKTVRGYGYVIQ